MSSSCPDNFRKSVLVVWRCVAVLQPVFKLSHESFPVGFLQIETSTVGYLNSRDCRSHNDSNGPMLAFWKWLQYHIFAKWREAVAHKCEIGIVSLFPSSTVKEFGELCIVYKAEMACFGPCFDCLSIQVRFTVAPAYAVAIKVSNDHL